jgi:triacylglycerol lipase
LRAGVKTRRISPLPIILAHGICPFHRLMPFPSSRDNARGDRFHYFRKIRSTLLSHGFPAFHTRVSWAGSLERRASDLRRAILGITDGFSRWPAVHIIAHSMGGLDARYMICRYRMEKRVISLTTIGTPHLGTSYADWGLRRLGFLVPLSGRLGLDLSGFLSLSREACARLNESLEPFEKANGVRYQTVAGTQPLERMFMPFRFPFRIIREEEGENDGLVSLRSAMWKEEYFLEEMDADHLNQIGWWNGGEARAGISREEFERGIRDVYLRIARGLPR